MIIRKWINKQANSEELKYTTYSVVNNKQYAIRGRSKSGMVFRCKIDKKS